MSIEDDIARIRQEADQASAESAELANVVAAFYNALVAAGMPQEHARDLTGQWMSDMTMQAGEDE